MSTYFPNIIAEYGWERESNTNFKLPLVELFPTPHPYGEIGWSRKNCAKHIATKITLRKRKFTLSAKILKNPHRSNSIR